MQSYVIERNFGPVTPEQVAETGATCKRVAREQFPDSIVWKHSHATESEQGLTTHCLYEATDEDTIRAHAKAAGIPCDTITPANVIGPDDFA